MAGTTASQGIPYAERPDPFELTADLRGSFNKIDSVFAQTRGESTAAVITAEQARTASAQALARVLNIEDPVFIGPEEPGDGSTLWVDTDAEPTPAPVGDVYAADIVDATDVGRNVLTAPLSVDARNALSIFTGTRALLDEGTDTAERTWDAAELAGYVADKVTEGGGAASWDDLTGKPSEFPPEAHAHAQADVTGLPAALTAAADSAEWTNVTGKPDTFPSTIPEVAGLQAALDEAGAGGTPAWSDVTGKPATFPSSIPNVSGLDSALAGKLPVSAEIGQEPHLDSITTPGFYSQLFTAWAVPEKGYPAAKAGRLLVQASGTGTQVSQLYWTFDRVGFTIHVRNFFNAWSDWATIPVGSTAPGKYWNGDIPDGTNINNLRTPGLWAASKTSIVSTLTNWPEQLNGTAGFLEVMAADNGLTMQKVTGYGGNAVTVQRTSLSVSNGTYTPWEQITPPNLSAYATKVYVDSAVAGATGTDVTGVYEQNTTRRTAFMQAMGGPINTGGKAAFALRTDHGYKNMAELILPLCRTRGIVPSTLYNPRNWARPENAGYTAADLNTWVAAGEVEVWNHGATHSDASDLAALEDEIVASIAEIESSVPATAGKVWGFAPPGVDTTTGYGGYGNGATPEKWDSAAGRLILKHHAINNAYVPGTGHRILDGTIRDGVSHFTMDNATVAELKSYIDTAISRKQGVQFMVHPYVVDTAGKITTAQIAEVLDYVVAKRNAGELVTLTPYQMMVADSTRVPSAPASHPLLYMSGQRNVAGTLLTGWAAATTGVKLSRQGSTVTLAIDVTRTSDLTGFAEVMPIPLGFRPITSGYIQPGKSAAYNDGTTTHKAVEGWWDRSGTSSPLRFRDIVDSTFYQEGTMATFKAGQRLTNVVTWQTADPIPTSLPGSPA